MQLHNSLTCTAAVDLPVNYYLTIDHRNTLTLLASIKPIISWEFSFNVTKSCIGLAYTAAHVEIITPTQ